MAGVAESEAVAHLDAGRFREAFELLVDLYQGKVFGLAWSVMQDRAAAEDMAQEAFVRIWKALPGYRGEASLSTWIFAIARNTCLSGRRRLAAHAASSLDQPEVRAAAEALHPCEDRHLADHDMRALLGRLSDKYRRVLTLFYLEDRSYEQVAALLGIPMGTVKTYLHRGKKELGALIAARGNEEMRECPALNTKT